MMQPEVRITEFDLESAEVYCNKIIEINQTFGPDQPILLRICSPGGEIRALSVVYNTIKSIPNKIITYSDGEAASAGMFLLGLGDVRVVAPDCMLMLHYVQSGYVGTSEGMVERAGVSKKLNNDWFTKLEKRSGIKGLKELVKNTADGDLNMTPDDALKLGLIDYVGYVSPLAYQGVEYRIFSDEDIEEVEEEQVKPSKKKSRKSKTKA